MPTGIGLLCSRNLPRGLAIDVAGIHDGSAGGWALKNDVFGKQMKLAIRDGNPIAIDPRASDTRVAVTDQGLCKSMAADGVDGWNRLVAERGSYCLPTGRKLRLAEKRGIN